METRHRPYRSLFWPILLIGVGVVWLLGNLGLVPANSLALFANLWPLILIAIGLDFLFGRGSPLAGALIGLLFVAAVVAFLLVGPALGLKAPGGELKIDHFSEPLGQVTSATFHLESGSLPVSVHSAAGGSLLIDATIGHYGPVEFNVSGGSDKTINLRQMSSGPEFHFGFEPATARWDIGLAPGVPFKLDLNSGSGSVNLDLSQVKLAGLQLHSGSGSVDMSLPASSQPYQAQVSSGSGSVSVNLPAGNLSYSMNSGSGSVSLRLPASAAARVEVNGSGSGSLSVSSRLQQVSGDDKTGVWETSGYASAASKLLIQVAGRGSGSVSIR